MLVEFLLNRFVETNICRKEIKYFFDFILKKVCFHLSVIALKHKFCYLIKYECLLFQECPLGTYKNVTGSDFSLCRQCPPEELPHRAVYTSVRGICYFLRQTLCN